MTILYGEKTAEQVSEGYDLTGKVALITGATDGIGKEAARVLALRNCRVLIATRSQQKGEAAKEELGKLLGPEKAHLLEVFLLELNSLAGIREAAARFARRSDLSLHILINNAGARATERKKTVDGFEENFGTNHLGHFLFTLLLLPYLKKSAPSKVIFVSSGTHHLVTENHFDIDPNLEKVDFDFYKFYAHSKAANILCARELNERLSGTGVTAYSVNPGIIETNSPQLNEARLKGMGAMLETISRLSNTPILLEEVKFMTVSQGAANQVFLAVRNDIPGGYYDPDLQLAQPSPLASDPQLQKRLWNLSETLVGATLEEALKGN